MIYVLEAQDIAIIGTGNLGSIIATLLADNHKGRIIATKRNTQDIEQLRRYGIITTSDNTYAIKNSKIIIVTLKKKDLDVMSGIDLRDEQIVISAAANATISDLSDLLNHEQIIRVMPNIGLSTKTAAVGYNASFAGSDAAAPAVEYLFKRAGSIFNVKESQLAMVTVGACLPGLIAKAYELGANDRQLGYSLREAYRTFLKKELEDGTAEAILNSSFATVNALQKIGESYDDIYNRVASPGGGTQKAHRHLLTIGYYKRLTDEAQYGQYKTAINYIKHLEMALSHFKRR